MHEESESPERTDGLEVEAEQAPEQEEWEGQEAMGARLVAEAQGITPVVAAPIDDRVLLFPVVPDEDRPVDIHIVRHGGQDLPEMGVICGVGWKVNKEAVEELRILEDRQRRGKLSALERAMKAAIEQSDVLGVGDIVAFNKFSGMDVQGSNYVVCSRLDVLTKTLRLPVRLRTPQERWDRVQEDRRQAVADEGKPSLVAPSGESIEVVGRGSK